jgi:hypothetical protein
VPGSLGKSARERKAREIVQASGADTLEHFEKVVMSQSGITFREQSKVWFTHMSNRKSKPVKPSTLLSWDGIVSLINESFGDLPLAALMEDQSPVVEFIAEQHDEGKTPKTIRNYMQVLKAVVSNAKDPQTAVSRSMGQRVPRHSSNGEAEHSMLHWRASQPDCRTCCGSIPCDVLGACRQWFAIRGNPRIAD